MMKHKHKVILEMVAVTHACESEETNALNCIHTGVREEGPIITTGGLVPRWFR